MEENISQGAAILSQLLADDAFIVAVGDIDMDLLADGDFAEYAGQVFWHGVIFVGKGDSFRARPTEPRAAMFCPFGGEGIAQSGGSLLKNLELGHYRPSTNRLVRFE